MKRQRLEYRKRLYFERSHSEQAGFQSEEESLTKVYLSLPLFLVAEYFTELKLEGAPQGIVFPLGFLFFWALYFTYRAPGTLEGRLQGELGFSQLPSLILSGLIWLMKVIVSEPLLFLWREIFPQEVPPRPRRRVAEVSSPKVQEDRLPPEVRTALGVLGLSGQPEWNVIHRRYRELAKQFHPDLNPELTRNGNRFMVYDEAYRKLLAVKDEYFTKTRGSYAAG